MRSSGSHPSIDKILTFFQIFSRDFLETKRILSSLAPFVAYENAFFKNSGYIIARPGNDDYLYLDVNITFDESGKIYFGDLYILIFPYDSSTDSYPNGTAIYVYKNLVATKIASSIEQPISNTYVKCHVSGSSIILSEEFFVQVYNTTGGLVYTGVTSRVDNLSKGMYIVKMGDKTQKVIIK